MGPEFWQTGMGRRLIEGDIPRLIRAAEKIGAALEKLAGQMEREAEDNKPVEVKLTEKGRRATDKALWSCPACGDTTIEGKFWVRLNSNEVIDDTGDDQIWCPTCQSHHAHPVESE